MERKEVSPWGIYPKDLHQSASSACALHLLLDWLSLLGCPREMSGLGVSVTIVNIDCGALGTPRFLPTGSVVLKDAWRGPSPPVPLCLPTFGRQMEGLAVHSLRCHLFLIRAASALGHGSFRLMWHLLVHFVSIILKNTLILIGVS